MHEFNTQEWIQYTYTHTHTHTHTHMHTLPTCTCMYMVVCVYLPYWNLLTMLLLCLKAMADLSVTFLFLQSISRKSKRSKPPNLKDLLLLAVKRMMFSGVSK